MPPIPASYANFTAALLRAYPPPPRRAGRKSKHSGPSILDKLPVELLTHITNLMDNRSAVSLALVSRALTPSATDRLWRYMEISVPDGWGLDEAANMSDSDSSSSLSSSGMSDMALQAMEEQQRERTRTRDEKEEERGALLRTKLSAVLAQGWNKWQMVETITITTQRGCGELLVRILEQVSSKLRSLDMPTAIGAEGIAYHPLEVALALRHAELLETSSGLSFPSLLHVDFGDQEISCVETIPLLLQLAPNITSLAFATSNDRLPVMREFPRTARKILPLPQTTKIRQLSVQWDADSMEAPLHMPPPTGPLRGPFATILDLLSRSPFLCQLSMTTEGCRELDPRLVDRLAAMENLTDVYWAGHGHDLPSSPHVRRVMLDYGVEDWDFPFSNEANPDASFPALEQLFVLSYTSPTKMPFPPPTSELPLTPGFVAWLAQRPQLRTVHVGWRGNYIGLGSTATFDTLENFGTPSVIIRSVQRGEDELLLVSMRLCDLAPADDRYGWLQGDPLRVIHSSGESYGLSPTSGKPDWQLFTHYEGALVPEDIVEKTKDVEDPARERDWEGRGVKASEAAWKILTDWRGQQPELEDADILL